MTNKIVICFCHILCTITALQAQQPLSRQQQAVQQTIVKLFDALSTVIQQA